MTFRNLLSSIFFSNSPISTLWSMLSKYPSMSNSMCRDYTPRPPLLEVFMAPHHLYLIDGQYLSGCPCHYSMHIGYHGGSVAIQVSILCWKTSYRQSHVSG